MPGDDDRYKPPSERQNPDSASNYVERDSRLNQAEADEPTALTCRACERILVDAYYQSNDSVYCQTCADTVRLRFGENRSRLDRVISAILYGVGGGILGAALYYMVLALTHYQVGLVAAVVGVLVGRGVRKGSGGRGGWRYQIIAALLTYIAIAATYIPQALGERGQQKTAVEPPSQSQSSASKVTRGEPIDSNSATPQSGVPGILNVQPAPMRLVIVTVELIALALCLPVVVSMSSPMMLLIIGFGVWEAWRINKRVFTEITGPDTAAPAGHYLRRSKKYLESQ